MRFQTIDQLCFKQAVKELNIATLSVGLSSPSGVWGKAAAYKRFGVYWSQKVQLWWKQFFADFLKNKCNFLHKNKLDIVRWVRFLVGRHHMRSFFLVGQSSPLPYGSRRLCIYRQLFHGTRSPPTLSYQVYTAHPLNITGTRHNERVVPTQTVGKTIPVSR